MQIKKLVIEQLTKDEIIRIFTIMNKNNFTISNEDADKIKKCIKQTNDTTSNLRDINDINIVLQK